jgi:hypothetical protein
MSNTRKSTYLRATPTKKQRQAISIKKTMRRIKSTRKEVNTLLILAVLLIGVKNTVCEIRNNAEKLQKVPGHELKLVLLEFLTQQFRLWNSKDLGYADRGSYPTAFYTLIIILTQ